jgi:hypothetical protein
MLELEEELDEEPESKVEVAAGTTTVVEPKVWVNTTCVTVADVEEPDAVAAELRFAAATTKGFEELPPVPYVRPKETVPIMSCFSKSRRRRSS